MHMRSFVENFRFTRVTCNLIIKKVTVEQESTHTDDSELQLNYKTFC